MKPQNIIIGQRVDSSKMLRAKEFRKQMTPAEKVLWQHLRGNRLEGFHFRRQQVIDGFIVDFYCHAAGLVVEVDGEIHESQLEADAERDEILEKRGLVTLRFKNIDVMQELDRVLKVIVKVCKEIRT